MKPALLTRANTGAICFVIKGFQLARGPWEWHDQHSQDPRSAAAISRGPLPGMTQVQESYSVKILGPPQ